MASREAKIKKLKAKQQQTKMYNFFKHKEDQDKKQRHLDEEARQTRWEQRHSQHKLYSHQQYSRRVNDYVETALRETDYVQDDHFEQWRKTTNKQFRDIAESRKLKGFKAFVHKPNSDMQALYSQRERIQQQYLARKSEVLVRDYLIHPTQKLRSLRSQGPLTKQHSFREKDTAKAQPHMRFGNVTDKERFMEHYLPESKFLSSVYSSFDKHKKKIGRVISRSLNNHLDKQELDISEAQSRPMTPGNFGNTDDQENPANRIITPVAKTHRISQIVPAIQNHSEYRFENINKNPEKVNSLIKDINEQYMHPLRRKHFKGAKQLSMGVNLNIPNGQNQKQIQAQASKLLKVSQYDREKHLENITKNTRYEGFMKNPIL